MTWIKTVPYQQADPDLRRGDRTRPAPRPARAAHARAPGRMAAPVPASLGGAGVDGVGTLELTRLASGLTNLTRAAAPPGAGKPAPCPAAPARSPDRSRRAHQMEWLARPL